ncbi:MAG: bifunctional 3-deoxy-7-phosphoheptulonate synthase/chorismate mutase type II [Bacteroidales bacterium]|nr:bifunctional 3-deoxy-7-phosphoheptulonate synthase/chorismate mutase type II [Bacteroidales bacterium]
MKMNFATLTEWGIPESECPAVFAGPCSAETEEQVMQAALALDKLNVRIFRAGIWKPRTRPGAFEGVGDIGLPWLKRVKEETSMKVATEVASAAHVNQVLKNSIDVLWIGARTSANPFLVQEIADALHGRDVAVMIKNPINPDLGLWMGAIERIYKAGIRKIAAIHRGFSSYTKNRFRNQPEWQLPVDLKRQFPDLPLINDPSHIAGKRELIFDLCQKALDLNYDGLFIESHVDPDKAWSDARQQITPEQLGDMLNKLVLRKAQSLDEVFLHSIEELRAKIDKYDQDLIALLSERMLVAQTIGKYKKLHNITILQQDRWNQIMTKNITQGEQNGLSADFLTHVFKSIHEESINHQTQVMKGGY